MTKSDQNNFVAHVEDVGEDYTVGYGKPPKHSQFQKGKSGNPTGRKRPLASDSLNLHERIEQHLLATVEVSIKGKNTRMAVIDLLIKNWVKNAANCPKTAKLLVDFLRFLEALPQKWEREPNSADLAYIESVRDAANSWTVT